MGEVQINKHYKEEPIKFNNVKKNVKHSCASDALTNTNYLDKKKKKKGIFGGIFGGKKNKNKNKDYVGAFPRNDTAVAKKTMQAILSTKRNNSSLSSRVHSERSI